MKHLHQDTLRRNQTRCVAADLRKLKLPKPNIFRQELTAFKKLKDDNKVVVLLTDKGNTTVIVNRSDCKLKIQDLLQNGNYRSFRNPTRKGKDSIH